MWFERFGSSELVRGALHSHHSSSFFCPPSFCLALFPFYTSICFPFFIYVSVFPCLGQLLVLSILTSEWLGKAGYHGMEYGLVKRWAPRYGVGSFLACTALVLSLSFSSGVLWGVEHEVVLGYILGPLRGSHHTSSAVGLLGLGLGPLTWSGPGFKFQAPH